MTKRMTLTGPDPSAIGFISILSGQSKEKVKRLIALTDFLIKMSNSPSKNKSESKKVEPAATGSGKCYSQLTLEV